jgi:hypothetical protein
MGLAYQAIELGLTAGTLDGTLRRVVRQLRI